jgi:hypothetical protein
MQPLLSILIATLPDERRAAMLSTLHAELVRQTTATDALIEILMDDRPMSVSTGEKRSLLFDKSSGRYTCSFDDDDWPAADYIAALVEGCKSEKDCVTFDVEHTQAGRGRIGYANFSLNYIKNSDTDDNEVFVHCERIPNHLCPMKRELVSHVARSKGFGGRPFPATWRGEDWQFAKMMRPELRTEFHIDRVLYEYRRFK